MNFAFLSIKLPLFIDGLMVSMTLGRFLGNRSKGGLRSFCPLLSPKMLPSNTREPKDHSCGNIA